MASTSSATRIPTAWLVPPPGLLPSNTHADLEPISLAISCIFAAIAIITTILLFFKTNKGNYIDDTAVDDTIPPRTRFTTALPYQPRRPIPEPDTSSLYSPHSSTPDPYKPTVPPPAHHTTPTQQPPAPPTIVLNSETSSYNFDDSSTLNSEALYAEYQRTGVMPGNSGRGSREYAPSFVPSEFVMLAPEAVGLHGRVWRAGDGGM